jgi:hypothetical protein
MKEIQMNSKITIALLLFVFTISSCAPSVAPTEELPIPAATEEPLPTTPPEIAPQPELPISTAWKAIRDQRFGFGLAVPCWWLVSPIPDEGFGGAMIIKNYDDAYFNANSNKGFWDWPNGTLKLDVVVMEGVDPAKSDVDAYMEITDPTITGIVSAEQQQFGAHTATVLTVANLVNTNDPDMRLFFYRPSPNILIMIVPVPQTIIDTPDFQALLSSIVLTPDEQITLPTITPAPALIDASCAG